MNIQKISVYTATLLAIAALNACGKSDSPPLPAASPASSSDVQPGAASSKKAADSGSEGVVEPVATLGITVDEYVKSFDDLMMRTDSPFRANFRTKTNDDKSVGLAASLNDHLTIMVMVDKKSQKITNLLFLGTGDGTSKSGADVAVIGIAALASIFPDAKTAQVGPMVVRLMQEYQDGDSEPASHIVNGIRLSHSRSAETGALFAASPI
ncbi:hypothetical protein LGN17_00005 [Burkholderia sp. AU30280]|uniref:hypothetical protein n=1 Tax=Burkholderia sp. AU30280 TaxID=2879628 RepID=UPI001CF0E6DE|nr:hypothetical protein [Burkholderia sp. AU30280]MCA8270904.1 hypothetical protein [Burkholderia sp. AU30280]